MTMLYGCYFKSVKLCALCGLIIKCDIIATLFMHPLETTASASVGSVQSSMHSVVKKLCVTLRNT